MILALLKRVHSKRIFLNDLKHHTANNGGNDYRFKFKNAKCFKIEC